MISVLQVAPPSLLMAATRPSLVSVATAKRRLGLLGSTAIDVSP
jgi:hypothetical protein